MIWTKSFFVCVLTIWLAGAACAAPAFAEETDPTITLQFGGQQRSFILHLPASYSPAVAYPVMLVFAGYEGTAQATDNLTKFDEVADDNGFIVVYPQPNGPEWVVTGENNDLQFVQCILGYLSSTYSTNLAQTYVVGYGEGGRLAITYACSQAPGTYVAGVGIVADDLNTTDEADCDDDSPPPTAFVLFHGTGDLASPYQGGPGAQHTDNLSAPATAQFWATMAGCDPNQMTTTDIPDELNSGEFVTDTLQTWPACADGVTVNFYTIPDGGHTWPGSKSTVGSPKPGGAVSLDLPASTLIWQLLSPFCAPAAAHRQG